MKIKLNIDNQELQNKPAVFDGRLRKRLCSEASIREVTPEQLIECVKRGRSFTPAVMTGTTGDTWQSQQIICADIDNDTGKKDADGQKIMIDDPLTPVRALEIMEQYGIYPYFMYYSFSFTNAWPKFRIVLVLNKPIEDPDIAKDVTNRFAGIFNQAAEHCADTTASDNARLYYGGKADSVFYINRKTTTLKRLQALPEYETERNTERATDRAETAETPKEYKSTPARKSGEIRPYSALQAQFEADKKYFDLAAYIERTTASRPVKRGKALYFNPCPLCGHNDDFQVTGSLYHCFGASGGTGGSIIDYLMNKDGLDQGAACDKFKFEIMGYDRDEWRRAYIAYKYPQTGDGGALAWDDVISDPDDPAEDLPAADQAQDHDHNDSTPLFQPNTLYNDDGQPVFITAREIDALAIIEAKRPAIALYNKKNLKKIIEILKAKQTRTPLIVVLDNDPEQIDGDGREIGKIRQDALTEFTEALRKLNISYITADVCKAYKDLDTAFTADPRAFIGDIENAERQTNKPDNTADYVRQIMAGEIESLLKQGDRRTGFPNLDQQAGGVYSGLYIVGGMTSVGKTTFISQIADQMATLGQHVLFFSMEQSRLEMVSKSIARQTAATDPQRGVSSIQIRKGAKNDIVTKATVAYLMNVSDRMSIIEGNFNCTVSFIGSYTRRYMAQNDGIKPIVIIDYLQVLRPEKDPETGRKMTDTRQIIDYNVTELKRLSRSLEIPVFVVSSINRSNYLTPIDFEAFKESGGIEYTADVVWGLQLSAVHDDVFNGEGKIKEKREAIARAKEAMPRDIELVCLKNRYGKSRYAVQFTYYPQFDYFVPASKAMSWDDVIRK